MIDIERETTVNASDGDDVVRIWTAQRRFITQLRKHPKATETRSGVVDSSIWAEFIVDANDWSPVSGVKRTVVLSDEQRRALSERGARTRAAQLSKNQAQPTQFRDEHPETYAEVPLDGDRAAKPVRNLTETQKVAMSA
jgi:hypothetical protein